MSYARGTTTTDDRTRSEIETMLLRYGADEFGYVTRRDAAVIGFLYRGLRFEMQVPLPDPDDPAFTRSPKQRSARSKTAAQDAYLAERRRRWRALCLVIKAKLVAIDDHVATFEAEFLPYLVTATGQTVAQRMTPLLEHAVATGQPLALPAPPEA
ncbi:MAG: hypothetical protein AAF612_10360 [Planctomycetota bacterium]